MAEDDAYLISSMEEAIGLRPTYTADGTAVYPETIGCPVHGTGAAEDPENPDQPATDPDNPDQPATDPENPSGSGDDSGGTTGDGGTTTPSEPTEPTEPTTPTDPGTGDEWWSIIG